MSLREELKNWMDADPFPELHAEEVREALAGDVVDQSLLSTAPVYLAHLFKALDLVEAKIDAKFAELKALIEVRVKNSPAGSQSIAGGIGVSGRGSL